MQESAFADYLAQLKADPELTEEELAIRPQRGWPKQLSKKDAKQQKAQKHKQRVLPPMGTPDQPLIQTRDYRGRVETFISEWADPEVTKALAELK